MAAVPVEAVPAEARPIGGAAGNCTPAYPASAVRQGQQGVVTLRITVSPLGRATTARVEHSSGAPVLDEAVLAKVLRDCRCGAC